MFTGRSRELNPPTRRDVAVARDGSRRRLAKLFLSLYDSPVPGVSAGECYSAREGFLTLT
jgi:hypothetical protein